MNTITSSINRTIAKNTAFLYVRMILVMFISLFTSRVLLKALGVEDYGIYNLVCGIVAFFQVLNGSLADATQRYITFELGNLSGNRIAIVFSTSIILHLLLGVFIVIIAEPIGLWFLHNKLLIPADRSIASEWIFHFSVVSLFFMIISVPYNAMIIAHEHMKAFAGFSIVDALGKLLIAFVITCHSRFDRLILYGALMVLFQIGLRFLYVFYCRNHFPESNVKLEIDWNLAKDMGGFATWTIIGNLAYVCITQGINLLLGMFFLPAINAARGLAAQIESGVKQFAKSFQTAINPQITKQYASGHLSGMHALIFRGTKFSFFLMLLPLIPIFIEARFLLNIWLSTVPDYTLFFTRIILIIALINCFSNALSVAAKASGRIKTFELVACSLRLSILPVSYFLLQNGGKVQVVFYVYLIVEIIAIISNIIISHKLVSFSVLSYCRNVIFPIVLVSVTAPAIPTLVYLNLSEGWGRFVLVTITALLCTFCSSFFLGLTKHEQAVVLGKIKSFL
ncbi:MAG: lipopolysaccharide biosynthesis protein [Bacteroidales bacterium]|nr:lipopolysaccharide biosynthesis protein [Bacteroidales bacterium]